MPATIQRTAFTWKQLEQLSRKNLSSESDNLTEGKIIDENPMELQNIQDHRGRTSDFSFILRNPLTQEGASLTILPSNEKAIFTFYDPNYSYDRPYKYIAEIPGKGNNFDSEGIPDEETFYQGRHRAYYSHAEEPIDNYYRNLLSVLREING